MDPFAFEKYLNTFLDPEKISDYCPNGLQVEGKRPISRLGIAVSANLMTIEKAVTEGLDALIVHHGLFWNRDPYPVIGAKYKKLSLLIENGISLYAYHLPLDAHEQVGNNWVAARNLGLEELTPFGKLNGIAIGVMGLMKPERIDQFVKRVENFYQHPAHTALGGKEMVSKVALISGGAYRELKTASEVGADCFITGNHDEPAWGVAFEEGIHFLALGHSATEKIGPLALTQYIKENLGVETCFLDVPNPF